MHWKVGRPARALVAGALVALPTQASPAACFEETIAPEAETLFIRAKKVIQRPGQVLENAAVLVRDGRIVAVGSDLTQPDDAREISGEVVCASFLDPWAAVGLSPDAIGDPATSAATRALDGYDPYGQESLRREALRAGVTCVRLQTGSTSRFSGIGALVRLAPGLSPGESVVVSDCSVSMNVGSSANVEGQPRFEQQGEAFVLVPPSKTMDPFDRIAELDRVLAAVENGRNYLQSEIEYKHDLEGWQKTIAEKETELEKDAKKAKKDREKEEKDAKEKGKEFKEKKYKEDKKPQPPRYDEDNAVMARVANGELPLVVQANRSAEIRGLLQATAGFDRLRLVLAGGTEAMSCVQELVDRGITVLVWPALRGRGAPDEYEGADLTLAAELARAGVQVLIGTGGVEPGASRDLPLLAEIAISGGLERERAFEALTIGAARVLDAADRIGSVERGKDADLLILDGEPLAAASRVRYVISLGRVVVTPED